MQLIMLKTKIHRAKVTHAELHYEGSCAIDGTVLDFAKIREHEQIQIYNIDNGERFTTYAIRAEEGSGIISINGAAAHLANVGDYIIICAYANLTQEELRDFKPNLIYMNEDNSISRSRTSIPIQLASAS